MTKDSCLKKKKQLDMSQVTKGNKKYFLLLILSDFGCFNLSKTFIFHYYCNYKHPLELLFV
jgi:hypothetical protein